MKRPIKRKFIISTSKGFFYYSWSFLRDSWLVTLSPRWDSKSPYRKENPASARAPSEIVRMQSYKKRALNLIGHRRHSDCPISCCMYRFSAPLRQFYSQTLRQEPRQCQLADTIVFQAIQHSRCRDFHFRVISFVTATATS